MQLAKFALVGGVGFITDLLCFYFFIFSNFDPLLARIGAFWCAMTVTWLGNRFFTFPHSIGASRVKQFARHILVSHSFGALNIGVFYALSLVSPLLVAFVVGTLIAMGGNFMLGKLWVFRQAEKEKAVTL